MEQIIKISDFILNSFVHIWPYLAITIPLEILVQLTGAAKYINKIISKNPFVSIVIATAIGAISPFCSCGVIPVIFSLLIGGVPLAPVMSFWIASPSMDPEIFMLSVATIGWKLSVWRLSATCAISLLSGIITHYAVKQGFFGEGILRTNPIFDVESKLRRKVSLKKINNTCDERTTVNCCISYENPQNIKIKETTTQMKASLHKKIIKETWKAFSLVVKFMAIAFFISALIEFYLPKEYITNIIGGNNQLSVLYAALVGIPFYTSNITALPLISGLLSLGMNHGAVLAFLIAGPVTTLPAMMAVWGIVKPRVFFMYLLFSFSGAIIVGYLYNIIN